MKASAPSLAGNVKAYRSLQRSLFFFFLAHALALVSMATLLAPAMDMTVDIATRAAWVADHPWQWRLGWIPWQACALSDLLVSLSLVWWTWSRGGWPRRFAVASMAMTLGGAVPEQWAEAWCSLWMPGLDAASYAGKEVWLLVMTGTWGGLAYVAMLVLWSLCAIASSARDARWRGALMVATGVDAVLFIGAGVGVWYVTQTPGYPGFGVVRGLNTVAFPLLLLVNLLLAGVLGQAAGRDVLGGVRDMLRPLPFLPMRSDIKDVVYLNWWVPAARVRHLLPQPLALCEREGMTPLSILHYRHGGFGWAFLGPLRRLLPSPVQSNWRLYCEGGGIYFVRALISGRAHAVGARLFSDGLPAVWDRGLHHRRDGSRVALDATTGDLSATVLERPEAALHPDAQWLIEVSGAVHVDPVWGVLRHAAIDIPIDLEDVRPAELTTFSSEVLAPIVEGCPCIAFTVPSVAFSALGDETAGELTQSQSP